MKLERLHNDRSFATKLLKMLVKGHNSKYKTIPLYLEKQDTLKNTVANFQLFIKNLLNKLHPLVAQR